VPYPDNCGKPGKGMRNRPSYVRVVTQYSDRPPVLLGQVGLALLQAARDRPRLLVTPNASTVRFRPRGGRDDGQRQPK
jgi:hypothetical protein